MFDTEFINEQQLSDKRTGRHKGCAYVKLSWVEDVHRVVEVSATTMEFQCFPILIKILEVEKNYGVEGLGLGIDMGASSGIGIGSSMGMASMVVGAFGVVEVLSHGVRKRKKSMWGVLIAMWMWHNDLLHFS